jgi:hypothetical protein
VKKEIVRKWKENIKNIQDQKDLLIK